MSSADKPMMDDADGMKRSQSKRDLPRIVLYPVLVAIPILSLFVGIILGEWPYTARLAIWPNPSPVGNWVIFLIGMGIAVLLLANYKYKNRGIRVRPGDVIVVFGVLVSILLAGTVGLQISGLCVLILLVIASVAKRAEANRTGRQE